MKTQKRTPYILALPLFIIASVVMQFSGIGIGNASAATLTWDGSAGDGLFSTGANWNTNNAPTNGDVLSFSLAGVSSSPTYTNDISGLSVAGINVSGTPSAYAAPTIVGNTLTLTGNISNTASSSGYPLTLNINTGLILGANVTTTGQINFGGVNKTTHLGSYNLNITNTETSCGLNPGALSGSGTLDLSGISGTNYELDTASNGFTGNISINSGKLFVTAPANLGNASGLTVSGSGIVSLFSEADSTWSTPLTLGGSGSIGAQHSGSGGCSGGGEGPTLTATIDAPVSLTSDFVYNGDDNFVITGDYEDNDHAFTVQSGVTGTLTTPQGEVGAPVTEVELSGDQPSTFAGIGFNETGILSGTRGSVSVTDGGILKGTGTAQNLSLYSGGIVNPGNSPGTLTVLESYNQAEGTYQAEILNKDSYDQLAVGANYGNSGSAVNLNSTGAILDLVLYDGWKIDAGNTFTIINNLSSTAVQGTFAGLAEGTQFTVGGVIFTISYVGGDGNDVVVTAVTGGVGAPNTGIQKLIMANPAIVAGLGILAAASILFITLRRKSNR